MDKKKVLWISDMDGTGYSTASIATINGFVEAGGDEFYDIYYYVVNSVKSEEYHRENLKKLIKNFDEKRLIVPVKNALVFQIDGTKDENKPIINRQLFGFNVFIDIIRNLNPHITVILNDNSYVEQFGKLIRKSGVKTKIVGYMPIDCENFPHGFFKGVEDNVDAIITMNEFSKNEIIKTGFKKPVSVIHHPIPQNNYFQIEKEEARKKMFGHPNPNAFVIVNNNNNQSRKRTDITVEAFAKFLHKYPTSNATLILKSVNPSFNDKGKDMHEVIKMCKEKYFPELEKRLVLLNKFLNYEEVNSLYNCADICVNTTSGEGWGLIPCEASLCGVPQIVPDNTSHPEIFGGVVDLVKTDVYPWNTARMFSDDPSNKGVLIMQGTKDHLNANIKENNKLQPFDYPFTLKIFIAPMIQNPDLNLGELKISSNLTCQSGSNNLNDVNKIIEKFKPDAFQIFIILGKDCEFATEQVKKFDWTTEIEKTYSIEMISKDGIKSNYNSYLIKVRIPDVEEVFKKIEYYYLNPDKVKEDGQKCKERIMYFNEMRIGKELLTYFNNTTTQNIKKKK
jgi:glycosyltransferase involved in cell wall biosynthesis